MLFKSRPRNDVPKAQPGTWAAGPARTSLACGGWGASLPLACGPAGWQVSFLPPSLHLGGAALGPVIHSVNHLLVELSGKRQ